MHIGLNIFKLGTSISRRGLLPLMAAPVLFSPGFVSAQELTFGCIPQSLEYPYNVSTAEGFEEAAAAVGVKTIVVDPRGSVEKQGNAIQQGSVPLMRNWSGCWDIV